MNNKQLYQDTFSKVDSLSNYTLEDYKKKKSKFQVPKSLVACAAFAIILLATTSIADAATGGSIWEGIRVWLNGEEVNPQDVGSFDQNGNYTITLEDPLIESTDIQAPSQPEGDTLYTSDQIRPSFLEEEGRYYVVFYGIDKYEITDKIIPTGSYQSKENEWLIQGKQIVINATLDQDGHIIGKIFIKE